MATHLQDIVTSPAGMRSTWFISHSVRTFGNLAEGDISSVPSFPRLFLPLKPYVLAQRCILHKCPAIMHGLLHAAVSWST